MQSKCAMRVDQSRRNDAFRNFDQLRPGRRCNIRPYGDDLAVTYDDVTEEVAGIGLRPDQRALEYQSFRRRRLCGNRLGGQCEGESESVGVGEKTRLYHAAPWDEN